MLTQILQNRPIVALSTTLWRNDTRTFKVGPKPAADRDKEPMK